MRALCVSHNSAARLIPERTRSPLSLGATTALSVGSPDGLEGRALPVSGRLLLIDRDSPKPTHGGLCSGPVISSAQPTRGATPAASARDGSADAVQAARRRRAGLCPDRRIQTCVRARRGALTAAARAAPCVRERQPACADPRHPGRDRLPMHGRPSRAGPSLLGLLKSMRVVGTNDQFGIR